MAKEQMLDRVLNWLDRRAEADLTLPGIAMATGTGVEWLKKVVSREISDPGSRRIENLHEYLASKFKPKKAKKEPVKPWWDRG